MTPRPRQEELTLLLSIVAHVTRETVEDQLADVGLGVREHVVLNVIGAGAPTQLAIAAGAGLDKSTLLPVLDRLESQELIERRPDRSDRRVRVVTLTPAGRRALAQASRRVRSIERDLLADLDPHEQAQLRSFLGRIVNGRMSTLSVSGSCL